MKEDIKEKLNTHLLKIVFNNDLSINEQVAQIHQYLKQFDSKELNPVRMPIQIPTPKEIKHNVYDVYKTEEGMKINFLDNLLVDISEYIYKKEIDTIFNKYI